MVTEAEGGAKPPATEATGTLQQAIPELPPPAPRGGRPSVMTSQIKEQLCLLLSLGLSRRQAAAYLGFDHAAISRAAQRDEAFAAQLARAEDLKAAESLLYVVAESRRNWRAAAWIVEHTPKTRHQRTEEERQAAQAIKLAEIKRASERKELEEALCEERERARKQRARDREAASAERHREELRRQKAERQARRAKRAAEPSQDAAQPGVRPTA